MEHFFYLKDIFKKEIELYDGLLVLSQEEKEAVMKNEVNSLSEIVEKQKAALAEIKKLETEKEKSFTDIREILGLPAAKKRVKDIIEAAPVGLREELKDLAQELEHTAMKLRRAGTINKMLIDAQLQYASYCINLMTGTQDTLNIYSGSGRMEEGCAVRPSLVDQTV